MEERTFDLFVHGLKEMHYAESRLVTSLEQMTRDATDKNLKDGFRRHLKQTKEQVRRLERCFKDIDRGPGRQKSHGIAGLIEEYDTFRRKKPDAETMDAFAASAALRVERYEISAYESLISMAGMLGLGTCAAQLAQNLAEEEATAAELLAVSQKVTAKLAGVPEGAIRQTAENVGEQLKEGAYVAVGAADVVRERATDVASTVGERVSKALGRAEKRGRKVVDEPKSGRGRSRKR